MSLIRGIARQITRIASGVRSPEIYIVHEWGIGHTAIYQKTIGVPVVLPSDNLCLVIEKGNPSGNILLKAPEIHQIHLTITIPGNSSTDGLNLLFPLISNHSDFLIQEKNCSQNYIESLVSPKIFLYEKVDDFVYKVSENLFRPLTIPKVFGQSFKDPIQEKNTSEEKIESELRPKQKQSKDKIPTRSLSEWDILQPVLLPPLSLNFPEEFDFYRELRGYQQDGISWLTDHPSALLADEMGTGKTVQAVNALRLLFRQGKIRSVLVVCPPAVIGSVDLAIETGSSEGWSGHFYHWASELEVAVMRGGSPDQRKIAWERPFHIYITTYETLLNDINKNILSDIAKFDCIILDEAQKVKNRETKTSKAVCRLKAKYRWALTGTPIENKLDDIKSLFAFIRPGTFRGGVEDSPETVKTVIEPYMMRRLKQDVLQDLPEKTRQEDWLEMDKYQESDYKEALRVGREKSKLL